MGSEMCIRDRTWSAADPLSIRMYADAWQYPGWELHTTNNSFSVTSAVTAVPEPETFAIPLAGLGLTGALARRRRADMENK